MRLNRLESSLWPFMPVSTLCLWLLSAASPAFATGTAVQLPSLTLWQEPFQGRGQGAIIDSLASSGEYYPSKSYFPEYANADQARALNRLRTEIEQSYQYLRDRRREEGLALFRRAVTAYEENADTKSQQRMYVCFTDVRANLGKCVDASKCEELLFRIARARFKAGGYEEPGYHHYSNPRLYALEDLEDGVSCVRVAADQEKLWKRLLNDAEASGDSSSIARVLRRLRRFYETHHYDSSAIEISESIEKLNWAGSPQSRLKAMLETAALYSRFDRLDDALAKCRVAQTEAIVHSVNLHGPFCEIARKLLRANRLRDACELYLYEYKQSLAGGSGIYAVQADTDLVLEKALQMRDVTGGADFMNQLWTLSRRERPADQKLATECCQKLADFYAEAGEPEKARQTFQSILVQASNPKSMPSKETPYAIENHARVLKRNGYDRPSGDLEQLSKELWKRRGEKPS